MDRREYHIAVKLEQKQLHQMAKLGIPDFETFADCERRQQQMFRRFDRYDVDVEEHEDLRECDTLQCARDCCSEACHFGTRDRRFRQIRAGVRLFEKHRGPLFEVSIVHPRWARPIGQLDTIKIDAARQWHYRRIKTLSYPNIVALGSFEVSVNHDLDGKIYWAGEIHEIVAGAAKEDLKRAFAIEKRYRTRRHEKLVKVTEVKCLGRQLGYCLKRFVEERRAYISQKTNRQARRHLPLKSIHLFEHDMWLLDLARDARTIRYGCNQHGSKLIVI